MKHNIKLNKEKRTFIISAIKEYFLQEKNEELGDLAAELLLDFFIKELAPEFYNQGIFDAYNFMNERIEDLLALEKR